MTLSPVSQWVASAVTRIPCTVDFTKFPGVITLKHPAVRIFVSDSLSQRARYIFMVAKDAVLLVSADGTRWGYEDAAAKLQALSPVLGAVIIDLATHHLREGNAFAAAIWAAGLAFGTEGD